MEQLISNLSGKSASITIPSNQITNGRIDISTSNEIVISEANQGSGYNNIPEVIIENSSIKPEIIIESVDSSGGITAVVNTSNNTIISSFAIQQDLDILSHQI